MKHFASLFLAARAHARLDLGVFVYGSSSGQVKTRLVISPCRCGEKSVGPKDARRVHAGTIKAFALPFSISILIARNPNDDGFFAKPARPPHSTLSASPSSTASLSVNPNKPAQLPPLSQRRDGIRTRVFTLVRAYAFSRARFYV